VAALTQHRSLPVVQPARAWPLRITVVALSIAAAALFLASYFFPWWRLWLFAPQYPKGLEVGIALTGVTGDVRELNILNHYIGMSPLELAAITERRLAAEGVGIIAGLGVLLTLITGRRVGWLIAVLGAAFPITFVIDSQYWLYRFGHTLDPKAPIRLPPFTPQMFGTGQIGQFMTFSRPDPGFWIAVGGVACLVLAAVLRRRVCDQCARKGSCGVVCPSAFVGPGAGLPKE
jgi:copper chaperone NosL